MDAIRRVAAEARSSRAEHVARQVGALSAVATRARAELLPRVKHLYGELQERVALYEEIGIVPSLLKVVGVSGLEVPMNRALAWLLDPTAGHGTGRKVIEEIAKGLPFKAMATALERGDVVEVRGEQVWPDDAGSNREPDLVVIASDAILLIENKVASPESGPTQYADYRSALGRLADARGITHRQLWLTAPEKREVPREWSGSATHAQLAAWIRRAADAATTAWGRISCLLVAEQLEDAVDRDDELKRAKALLRHVRVDAPRPRDARMLRQALTALGSPRPPWREGNEA